MIKTVGDLMKLLHRYPSTTRISVGNDCDDTAQLNGGALNGAADEIILLLAPLPDDSPSKELPRKKKSDTADLPDDAAEAVEQCDHILTLCDEVPERAEDFAADIAEKVSGVREWIVENKHVTDKQLNALNGWEAGISKWIK